MVSLLLLEDSEFRCVECTTSFHVSLKPHFENHIRRCGTFKQHILPSFDENKNIKLCLYQYLVVLYQ